MTDKTTEVDFQQLKRDLEAELNEHFTMNSHAQRIHWALINMLVDNIAAKYTLKKLRSAVMNETDCRVQSNDIMRIKREAAILQEYARSVKNLASRINRQGDHTDLTTSEVDVEELRKGECEDFTLYGARRHGWNNCLDHLVASGYKIVRGG